MHFQKKGDRSASLYFLGLCVGSCAVGAAIFRIQAAWQVCWADLEGRELRSWGLRFIVCDLNGQLWAMDARPERSSQHPGYWKIQDHLIGRHTEFSMIGRRVAVPLSDCPFEIDWEDEPFDLVENGIVPEADMKTWFDHSKVFSFP